MFQGLCFTPRLLGICGIWNPISHCSCLDTASVANKSKSVANESNLELAQSVCSNPDVYCTAVFSFGFRHYLLIFPLIILRSNL